MTRIHSEQNLGNRGGFATGYAAVFEQVEEAILLEDDCLPHPSFFPYCEALLARYRDDERVMTISGDNFHFGARVTPDSYYFSRYPHLWGFATWRRAWRLYDPDIKLWPTLRQTPWLLDTLGNEWAVRYWADVFDRLHAGTLQTWDSQWAFACWANSALGCSPAVNLISNIGFGPTASGTTDTSNPVNALPTEPMELPLRHRLHGPRPGGGRADVRARLRAGDRAEEADAGRAGARPAEKARNQTTTTLRPLSPVPRGRGLG